MKYYILFFLLVYIESYASDCGVITKCLPKQYQYYFCNSTAQKIEPKCSWDPLSEPNPPYKVVRSPLPVKLRFCDSGPDNVEMQVMTGAWWSVYNKNYTQTDADNAAYAWNCICGYQNQTPQCTLNVQISSNPNDFAPYQSVTTARAYYWLPLSTCTNYCNKSCNDPDQAIIKVNNSKEFTGSDAMTTRKTKFFINDCKFNNDPDFFEVFLPEFKVINLTDLLMHELGHLLGMGHSKEQNPVDGTLISNCDEADGIMGTKIAKNKKSNGLSEDDICAFKKIYCNGLTTPVEAEAIADDDISNFPNPFEKITTIKFFVSAFNTNVNIFIYNQIGEKVKSLQMLLNEGEQTVHIDCGDLPSGIYYYTIQTGNDIKSSKFVLVK